MVEFKSANEIRQEIEVVSEVNDVEAGVQMAPLNDLTDAGFELLLWEIFRNRKNVDGYYDDATLMVAGADRGRDVWLTHQGNPAGLVQCKRLKSAFSAPDAVREVIKFILFSELDSRLLNEGAPFKYSLAVSTDPASTTVSFFTSPMQWLHDNESNLLDYTESVIGKYKSFSGFTAADKLDQVKKRLHSFSYELLRPSKIDSLLEDFPKVRTRFFKVRLVQDQDAFEEMLDQKIEQHGLGHKLGDKARGLLDGDIGQRLQTLKRSRFFPGSDIKKEALIILKQLEGEEYRGVSDKIRADAFGACARWLSRTGHQKESEAAVQASEVLGGTEDANVARAFLVAGDADWSRGISALQPLDNDVRVTAALQTVQHCQNSEHAVRWFESARFEAKDVDADGKAVLLMCLLETQAWDAAYDLAVSLANSDFEDAPILYHLAGLARLLSVIPEEFRNVVRISPPFARKQFPLWDDERSKRDRREASALFADAKKSAEHFGLNVSHTYELFSLWLDLHDPDKEDCAKKLLTSRLSDPDVAVHYVPLGISFNLKIDKEKVEQVLASQKARNPKGSFEVALCRFVLANAYQDSADALAYFLSHRDQMVGWINLEILLEFEVRASVQDGRIEPAKDVIERAAIDLTVTQKERLEEIIAQGLSGPGLLELETAYSNNATISNLANLVDHLGRQGFSDRFFELSRKLLSETRSISDAERILGLLNQSQRYDRMQLILSDAAELVPASLELRGFAAWMSFRNGDFKDALEAVCSLRELRDEHSDRVLHQNLLVASGRWQELSAFVEGEWKQRHNRSPEELHALAQLSGAINSPRLSEFLTAAADAGAESPHILLGCYITATECGLEEEEKVFKWFERAAELSGDDGPVQQMSIDEIVKQQPDWNAHTEAVWESYRTGTMPISLVASQLQRSSLEMQMTSIVLNGKQLDPRKRRVVSAFSGVRGEVTADLQSIGLDSTALVTLASLDLLSELFRAYDKIHIPHSTLGWLFTERRKLSFHQPSRIRDARALLSTLTNGKVIEFSTTTEPDAELATLVDIELAEMLASAAADDAAKQTIVVRSAPVHKIGSLMDETVDLDDYQTSLCSCQAILDKLADLGILMADEEGRARSFLSRSEQRWGNEPQIENGARLLLDGLSISYFQHTNLLSLLSEAGFEVVVPKSSIGDANNLIEVSENSQKFDRLIEVIRKALCDGITSGKVRVDKTFSEDDLKENPNLAILQLAGEVDAVVSDDRFINQYRHLDVEPYKTPIITTLDLLKDLNKKGVVSDKKLRGSRTFLRRAGYVLFPTCGDELRELFEHAQVKKTYLVETADLKAVRENIQLAQMRGWLVLTKEMPWFDKMRNDLSSALISQWEPNVSDEKARACSRWAIQLLDVRNWAGSFIEHDGSGMALQGLSAMLGSLALRYTSIQDEDAAERFSNWLKDEVFDPFKASDPDTHRRLIRSFEGTFSSQMHNGGQHIE